MPKLKENTHVSTWVDEMAALCGPDTIHWCSGSEQERLELTAHALSTGELEELDQHQWPGCYYHRTALNDVARTENLTFMCSPDERGAGPMNNWMAPAEGYEKASAILKNSMNGRTMYVIPFIMGQAGSPSAKIGVQITDSIYVVLNMRIMTRMGNIATADLGGSDNFTRCMHCTAERDIERRLILHFPADNAIISVGSGYGGNALLGKKCLALRIASNLARDEGWMAEHMLILGIESPAGDIRYVAAAFPSACGKTNLAMLIPPEAFRDEGWKVWCVGDDIAWMRIGDDGRLWAVNPENGFFGVAPGTSDDTNPNAMDTVRSNTLFTNVLKYKNDNGRWSVWWEDGQNIDLAGRECFDWQGNPWAPDAEEPGAHKNSRFTAPAIQCPCVSSEFDNPDGVPIDAIIFGGRRARVAPLVYETADWEHGTFVGAVMASEMTAAQVGQIGAIRRDPMAMLPFTGYHMGDYFEHWLKMGKKLGDKAPKIFHVNWFKSSEKNKFVWPGFGDNMRVLDWIMKRCDGTGGGTDTPIGRVPAPDDINLDGIDFGSRVLDEFGSQEKVMEYLLAVDRDEWLAEVEDQNKFLTGSDKKQLRGEVPAEIMAQHEALKARLA